MEKVTIEILSRSAGRILSHLNWLPVDVLKAIERYPYHTARCFAEGMKEKIIDSDDSLFASNYFYYDEHPNLCMDEFRDILSQRITILLKDLGKIAEGMILNKSDLKTHLNKNNKSVQEVIGYYMNGTIAREIITRKPYYDCFFKERIIKKNEYDKAIAIAEDSGATNLDGMKECWLVVNEWINAYQKDYPEDCFERPDDIDALLSKIDTDETPYPISFYMEKGDELILDGIGRNYDPAWPDVVRRHGKYAIVVWNCDRERKGVFYTSQQTMDLEDIRMPLYIITNPHVFPHNASFVVAKKDGNWGAILHSPNHFLKIIVPFSNSSLSQTIETVQEFLNIKCDFATWEEFTNAATQFDREHFS